jgi:dihydroneopterin aldolase
MKTKIKLEKMRFYAYHGLLPHEKEIGGEFEVNVLLEADVSAACNSDNVDDTINYAGVFNLVKSEMEIPSGLIEHVAGRIFRKLKEQYPQLTAIEARVAKLHPPVGGEVERAEVIVSS